MTERDVGSTPEDSFVQLLKIIEGTTSCSQELFSFLFDLLNDTDFVNQLDFFTVFFNIIAQAPHEIQVEQLKKLRYQVSIGGMRLEAILTSKQWVLRLLSMLPQQVPHPVLEEIMRLIHTLGTFNISVHELKYLLKLMHSNNNEKPSYWGQLLGVLCNLTPREGPNAYFELSGFNSGLQLPSLYRFPNNGYSFFTWIRFESLGDPTRKDPSYTPYIFSLQSTELFGLELFLQNKSLVVRTTVNKNKYESQSLRRFQFSTKKWYFIAVSHVYHFIKRSELLLYVNGKLVESVALLYPKGDQQLGCFLGTNRSPNSEGRLAHSRPYPLAGQLGQIYMLQDAIDATEMLSIYSLGPDLVKTSDSSGMDGHNFYLLKRSVKILFAFHPKAFNRPKCYEASTNHIDHSALALPGLSTVETSPLHFTLHRAGGIKLLLPLFKQLELPTISTEEEYDEEKSDDCESQENESVVNKPSWAAARATNTIQTAGSGPPGGDLLTHSPKLLQLLWLVRSIAARDRRHLDAMSNCDFFSLLSHLLASISPSSWSHPGTLSEMYSLVEVISASDILYEQFFDSIYLNPHLWIYTPVDVQKHIVDTIYHTSCQNPQFLRRIFGVQRALDVLRSYYWYSPEPGSEADEPLMKNGQIIGERPQLSEVRSLRKAIFRSIEQMTQGGNFTVDETSTFVHLIQDCEDSEQCIDTIQFLLHTLCHPECQVWAHFLKIGGFPPWLGLLNKDSPSLRFWALKFIGYLIHHLLILSGGNKGDLTRCCTSLKLNLQAFPLKRATYHILLAILLDSHSPSGSLSPIVPGKGQKMRIPEVLSVIFELLCMGGPPSLQRSVLSDFLSLLTESGENRDFFLSQTKWQSWLFALLSLTERPRTDKQSDTEEKWHSSQADIMGLGLSIITVLLRHCLHVKGGWDVIIHTHGLLTYFAEAGFFTSTTLLSSLNKSILTALLVQDSHLLNPFTPDTPLHSNIHRWLEFSATSLFKDFSPVFPPGESHDSILEYACRFLDGLTRADDDTWADFHFAQQLLDFFERFFLSTDKSLTCCTATPQQQDRPAPKGHFARPAVATPSNSQPPQQKVPASIFKREPLPSSSLLSPDYASQQINGKTISLLYLRLILTSLHETDVFLRTGKIQQRQTDLKQLEDLIAGCGSGALSGARGREAFNRYLNIKNKDWSSEIALVDAVLGNNIKRLSCYVDSLLQSESVRGTVMFILFVLYKAMKQSYDTKGRGAEMMLQLFREIVAKSKGRLNLTSDSTEESVQMFMSHFYNEEFEKLRSLDQELLALVSEQEVLLSKQHELVKESKTQATERVEALMTKEQELQGQVDIQSRTVQQNMVAAEKERRVIVEQSSKYTRHQQRRAWVAFLRNNWPSKTEHWKLDKRINPQFIHKMLKPNKHFDDHRDKVPLSREDFQSELAPVSSDSSVANTPTASGLCISTNWDSDDGPPVEEAEFECEEDKAALETSPSPLLTEEKAKVVHSTTAELIQLMRATPGHFKVTTKSIHFVADLELERSLADVVKPNTRLTVKTWNISEIIGLYTRRYLHRDCALEFFFENHTSVFLQFSSTGDRNKVFRRIANCQPPLLTDVELTLLGKPLSPAAVCRKRGITQQWANRKISNFDYLMMLNIIAGRSYNDVSQYPVFPWIIADYTSSVLDMSNPASFRDFSKPMGALFPERAAEVEQRYQSFCDPEIPKFHYGTHYSTIAAVLHYLIRLEPFTTFFLEFQGGKFDHPNRMFSSFQRSFENSATDASSVKEMIPECFYLPEMLINSNRFNFGLPVGDAVGTDAEGLVPASVGDVILPAWAPSPEAFIRIHREALESDYVSSHLNQWIDLIFGCKQKGSQAEESLNVFFYLTYQGMVDVDAINGEQQRNSVLSQIYNFGQTPAQLFNEPHPRRLTSSEYVNNHRPSVVPPTCPSSTPYSYSIPLTGLESPLAVIEPLSSNKVMLLAHDGIMGICSFSTPSDTHALPFTFEIDRQMGTPKSKCIDTLFAQGVYIQDAVAITPDAKTLFIGGDWNSQLQIRAVSSGKIVRSLTPSSDVITCIALSRAFLVLGSRDTNTLVYNLSSVVHKGTINVKQLLEIASSTSSSLFSPIADLYHNSLSKDPFAYPTHVLNGHSEPIRAVAVSEDWDIVISSSTGTAHRCLVHTLRRGLYLHTLPQSAPVDLIRITSQGFIVTYSSQSSFASVFSLNGELICRQSIGQVNCLSVSTDGNWLVAGILKGILVLSIWNLGITDKFETEFPVCALTFAGEKLPARNNNCRWLLAGLTDNSLSVFDFSLC